MAMNFFKKHKVEYKEIDVASDLAGRKGMVEKSGQMGVPVIDIDGTIMVGFDQAALKKLLKIE